MTKETLSLDTYDEVQLVESQSFRTNQQINLQAISKFSMKCKLFAIIALTSIAIMILLTVLYRSEVSMRLFSSIPQVYDLVTLNSTTALCLDGSPASYFVSRTGDPSKILIFFPPGAWCAQTTHQATLSSCYQRSKTSRGSSKFLPNESSMQYGILSNHPDNYFKDWKKVYFHYCDGSGFQGSKKGPVKIGDKMLYFRGHNITVERFEDVQKKIGLFTKAQKVVICGQSAGGLATLTWTNYLSERVQKGKVWSIADASIFYDTQPHILKQQFKQLVNITNTQINIPSEECMSQFPNQKQNCMFAQNIIKHIKTPLFLTQSLYDSYTLRNLMGLSCVQQEGIQKCTEEEKGKIQTNRVDVFKVLQQAVKNKLNGAWGIACVRHESFSRPQYNDQRFSVPRNSHMTMSRAISDWMSASGEDNVHLDTELSPVNCVNE